MVGGATPLDRIILPVLISAGPDHHSSAITPLDTGNRGVITRR